MNKSFFIKPFPTNNLYKCFLNTIYVRQFLSHFLLFLKAGSRLKTVQQSYKFFQTLFKKSTRAFSHDRVLYNKKLYWS